MCLAMILFAMKLFAMIFIGIFRSLLSYGFLGFNYSDLIDWIMCIPVWFERGLPLHELDVRVVGDY